MADAEAEAAAAPVAVPMFGAPQAKEAGEPTAEATPEEECDATFEPVVQLDEQDVKSGEEEEEILHQKRSKLYVYGESMLDKGTGNFTWLDRGIGEMKILRHRESGMIRLLMRQERTMKVIVNHVVDPRIVMSANNGSDRSWVWSAFDFADGELKETVFALKFGDREVANEYKSKFEEAQDMMAKLLDGADEAPSAEADEAAAAIAGLSTGETGEAAPEASPDAASEAASPVEQKQEVEAA